VPRLLLLAPCVKAIIDNQDNSLSLVEVIQGLKARVSQDEANDGKRTIPLLWSIVALWHFSEEEMGKTYEQRTVIVTPTEKEPIETVGSFSVTARRHQSRIGVTGFPIDNPGVYTIKLYLREAGKDKRWKLSGEYPIDVEHI
jgi:hypothetical protein